MRRTIIGVIGASQCDEHTKKLAEKLGEMLAKKGAVVVCGGLGGVMEATCRGAKRAGGLTVGIIPGFARNEANEYVDIPIVTAMSIARNSIIVRTADVLIAVSGGYGTLSEIAMALNLGKTVIGLETWQLEKAGIVDERLFIKAYDVNDAVQKAFAHISKRENVCV